jgi:hypothetical protein
MIIHFARITTDDGPFTFIRLPDSIDQDQCAVREWTVRLSENTFRGIGVAACNHDQQGNQIVRGSASRWEKEAAQIRWQGMGLSPLAVEDLLPARVQVGDSKS